MVQVDMQQLCLNCRKEECIMCRNSFKCQCKCNANNCEDLLVKLVCIIISFVMITISMYLSASSHKLMAQLISGALLSAGSNSFLRLSYVKFKKCEKMNINYILLDGGLNALFGGITCLIIASGEQMIVKASGTVFIFFVRASTGALASIFTKSVDCLKKDENSTNKMETRQMKYIFIGAFSGCVSGATAHISVTIGKYVPYLVVKSLVNILVSGMGTAFSNSICQILIMKENFSKKELISSIKSNMLNRTFREGLKFLTITILTNKTKNMGLKVSQCMLENESCDSNEHMKGRSGGFENKYSEELNENEEETAANLLMLSLI